MEAGLGERRKLGISCGKGKNVVSKKERNMWAKGGEDPWLRDGFQLVEDGYWESVQCGFRILSPSFKYQQQPSCSIT